MNTYWLILLLSIGSLVSPAQTIVRSMQTVDNDNELSMNVVGTRDGRPFRHTLRYDVSGLTKPQRDSVYERNAQVLATLGITNVPGMRSRSEKTAASVTAPSGVVTIACAACERKGQLELYSTNYLQTRRIKPKGEPQNRFPVTMQLGPDQYRLVYKQRGRRPVEIPFALIGGETRQLTIP